MIEERLIKAQPQGQWPEEFKKSGTQLNPTE